LRASRTVGTQQIHNPPEPAQLTAPSLGDRMNNPWAALDLDGDGPYVLKQDKAELAKAERFCARKGEEFARRHRYRTNLFPDPFTGSPDASIVVFTLNPGYTDDAKALRWRNRGCTGSDDWWHANSEAMRECYKANLSHAPQEFPLFFLDPRLRGSPGAVYYRQQFGALIRLYGERRVAEGVSVLEYFPYHSESFADLAQVPSQTYSLYLIRQAMARNACIVVLRKKRELLRAVPELLKYPLITANSKQNATVSPRNVPRFADLCHALRDHAISGRVTSE
jgi:hypothetical protein